MSIITKKGYNFAFNPTACAECKGKCCIGESGYIWVNSSEILEFAKYFNTDVESFKKEYLQKVNFRYSLQEVSYKNGFACIFFDMEKKQCKVYSLRPSQCRTFPFWEHFKINQREVENECIGIIRL